MQRQDYILRLIERLGQMLIALRKRIAAGEDTAVLEKAFHGIAASGGVDLDVARLASVETLILFVARDGEVDPTRCWLMAELLFLDGLQARAEGNHEAAVASFDKAVRLFGLVAPGGVNLLGWPEATERIAEIEALLGDAGD